LVDGDVDLPRGLAYSFPWSPASLRAWTTGYSVVIIHSVIGWLSGRYIAAVDAHPSLYASI